MRAKHWDNPQTPADNQAVFPARVVREGRLEPHFLNTPSLLSSASIRWEGITLDRYILPAILVARHEHPEHFLNTVVCGTENYEVSTKGRTLRFTSRPETTLLEPRGTIDEVKWEGPTQRIVASLRPELLVNALEETTHETDVELIENWNLVDRHISALLTELSADLEESSPAGRIYGESLANALAVYLLKRYSVRGITPRVFKGGMPRYRLMRVLDYIAANLANNVGLSEIAAVAGMSPHYFSELFRQSTGRTPHYYVLLQRIERAKECLRDPRCSIIAAGLKAGFQNASHFAHMFRRIVGTSPSTFRAEFWDHHRQTN